MKKLWQKKLNSHTWELDPFIESFETKDDIIMDQKLVKYDVLGSIAQALMLFKIGIISEKELNQAKKGLLEILNLYKENKFVLKAGDEDVHTKIENYLTENYGHVGKKIHTGRARNDQVLTVLRLYNKEQILLIREELLKLIESFILFAEKYEFLAMPGYTHMQKAMPSSIGMWASSFAESLLDDLEVLKAAYSINNQSPLGTAAGYGAPLKLDREYTAKLLGFEKVQWNSLYCQNSKGKIESNILASLVSSLLTLNKFATDVVLFTTTEFGYFRVSDSLCSGSSMLPQKRNVDVAELLRSKVHLVIGNYTQMVSMSSNLISGYNRDLQDLKKPLIESFEITIDSIKVANILINNLTPNVENLKKSLTPELFATHEVFDMVKSGKAFREAYQIVGSKIKELSIDNIDVEKTLKQSSHIGGTGNLGIKGKLKKFKKEEKKFLLEKEKYLKAIDNLLL